jgi:asparagine synthase (glutamine-hydrolysing)
MLKLRIHRRDLASTWRRTSAGWTAGESTIIPFRHPALEEVAEGCLKLTIREIGEGLEQTTLVIDRGELSITAGSWGTAPLYLVERDDVLYGDWDVAEIYPFLGGNPLDEERVAHFLIAFSRDYSRRTLFSGVLQLTERATARWPAGGLRIEYPNAIPLPRPRRLRPDADVAGAMQEIITESMRRWIDGATWTFGAELSSGLDSGTVAAVAASLLDTPLRTYGLIMPGVEGEGQRARRDEMIAKFGYIDTAFAADENLPLTPRRRVVPWEEIYYEAIERLIRRAASDGVAVLFNGLGGDELCAQYYDELAEDQQQELIAPEVAPSFLSPRVHDAYRDTILTLDRAPSAPIPSSAFEGFAAGAALYLRNGIWPVAPMSTPELVELCRMLPIEWRENRECHRQLMLRLGCSRNVAYPRATESFSPLFDRAMKSDSRPMLRTLFAESRLADLGYLDRVGLLRAYDDYADGRPVECSDTQLYAVATIEMALRSISP